MNLYLYLKSVNLFALSTNVMLVVTYVCDVIANTNMNYKTKEIAL